MCRIAADAHERPLIWPDAYLPANGCSVIFSRVTAILHSRQELPPFGGRLDDDFGLAVRLRLGMSCSGIGLVCGTLALFSLVPASRRRFGSERCVFERVLRDRIACGDRRPATRTHRLPSRIDLSYTSQLVSLSLGQGLAADRLIWPGTSLTIFRRSALFRKSRRFFGVRLGRFLFRLLRFHLGLSGLKCGVRREPRWRRAKPLDHGHVAALPLHNEKLIALFRQTESGSAGGDPRLPTFAD